MKSLALLLLIIMPAALMGQCSFSISIDNDTICGNSCTGVLANKITYFNGTPPYTYNVTPSSSGPSLTNMCPGTYTVSVTDAMGCFASATASVVSISNIPGLSVTPTITGPTCPGIYDGSISLAVTASTSPFTYSWNSYSTTSNALYNITNGSYNVRVKDSANNCNDLAYNVTPANVCGSLYGKAFNDLSFDCIYQAGEPGVNGSVININPGNYNLQPNAAGNYSVLLPYGNYTINQILPAGSPFGICTPAQNVTIGSSPVVSDFADTTSVQLPDAAITYITATQAVVGYSCAFTFQLTNNGTVPANGLVYFTVADSMTLVSAVPNYSSSSPGGDTLYWNYANLQPSQTINYTVNFNVFTNPNLVNFQSCTYAGVIPSAAEVSNQNDVRAWCVFMVAAYDPNDKSVNPIGQGANGGIYLTDSVLTYLVRFQNTGSAPAYNIFIEDSISSHLDLSSLKVSGASHSYSYQVTGSKVRFNFNNIMLPDSNANEPASHGWIQYQLYQLPGNQVGDVMQNTAYIYFDFNPPVITNTVSNTIISPLITQTSNDREETDWIIYPNPSNGILTFDHSLKQDAVLTIYDPAGRLVHVSTLSANQNRVELNLLHLTKGMYLYSVKDKQAGMISRGKILIH